MRLLFILFFFLLSGTIFSQGIFEQGNEIEGESKEESKFEFNGYVRASSFIGFDEFDFSNLFAEAAFQSKLHHDKAYLYSDIRVREAYLYNKSETRFQIKELFAAYTGTRFDAFLGNQIVEWGRGDGFNPTNCITPTNYFFLSGNVDDQKMSNFLLRFKYRFTDQIELDLITIPIYRASIYRYDLFDLGKMTQFSDMVLPGKSFDNMAFAARLNFEMSKAAFSFSWFRGFNPDYGFNLQNVDWSTSMPDISYAPTPYFKNLIGFDLALPLASWIFRSEIAYSQSKDYEEFMYVPNPDLSYVLGLEKSYKGFTSIYPK